MALVGTQTANRANGIVVGGRGYVESEPPVVAVPPTLVRGHEYVKAQAYTAPVMVGGRPEPITPVEIEAVAHRDRILVGGKDITFFRDTQTPTPGFRLTEPFAYGATTLVFPQTHAIFEKAGEGALKWLRKEKEVRIQRVGPAGGVVGTDYRGVITAVRAQGRMWVADVGGDLSGRASLRNKQLPLFRWNRDLGRQAHDAVRMLNLRFQPRLGPTTGIEVAASGGMSMLDWLNEICALGVKRNGDQYTLMPQPGNNRVWEYVVKDTTTKHCTIYLDDARVVPDLVNDLAEQPNRIYMTAVNPDGMKIKFGVYPGLKQGDAPVYPFADGRTFGVGTTDATVDAAGTIEAMNWKLIGAGYLSREDLTTEFTTDTETAVLQLQDETGHPVTGTMDTATWDALFDLDATGYSILQSRIEPAAQKSYVRRWNLTANGSRASRNPNYNPTRLPVDRNIDAGAGHKRQMVREFARRELARSVEQNWVGTIDVNLGGVIAGEHVPGAPLTNADLMPVRALRPGMNAWLPLFDGGTLFHIAGIDVKPGGRAATLTVDTQYRDLLPVAEIIARNRESRRDPARAFLNQHRTSKIVNDSLITFDEVGGKVFNTVTCPALTWTVFPVVAGQEGTIRKVDIQTRNTEASFVLSIWGKDPGDENLTKKFPDPFVLDADGDPIWAQNRDVFNNKVLLYAAGDEKQPCGYWPKRHTNSAGNTTAHPITGRWVDEAPFSYHTLGAPVLWVAIFPKTTTTIRPQRLLWPQLEEGS